MTASGDHLQPGIGSVDDCRMSPPEQPRTGETSAVVENANDSDSKTSTPSEWSYLA